MLAWPCGLLPKHQPPERSIDAVLPQVCGPFHGGCEQFRELFDALIPEEYGQPARTSVKFHRAESALLPPSAGFTGFKTTEDGQRISEADLATLKNLPR